MGLRCKDELIGHKSGIHFHTAVRACWLFFHGVIPRQFEFRHIPKGARNIVMSSRGPIQVSHSCLPLEHQVVSGGIT